MFNSAILLRTFPGESSTHQERNTTNLEKVMGDTALHRFAELEKSSRLVRKSASYSLLALFARCFSLSLLYYVLAVVSMKLRFSTSGLSLLWPSNALLVATLVLTPKRRWWVYLLSVIPAHIAALSPYHLGLSGLHIKSPSTQFKPLHAR
jgi:hypothetical protein